MKKYFTREEADALLPTIKLDLYQIQKVKHRFEAKYSQLKALKAHVKRHGAPEGEDPFFTLEAELEFMQLEADALLQSFRMKGVQLKDIDSGLIDFPAVVNGREVLLCWRLGEERVEHYHGLHDGFAGRKKLTGDAKNET
jgi:hypothetical protein